MLSKAKLIALRIVGGGGAVVLPYLLRDEFITSSPAPLTTPRNCEPGPGTIVISDATNKMSVAGGKLVITAAPTGRYVKSGAIFIRTAGRTLSATVKGSTVAFGWTDASRNSVYSGIGYVSGLGVYIFTDGGAKKILNSVVTNSEYNVKITKRGYVNGSPSGEILTLSGNGLSDETLLWIGGGNPIQGETGYLVISDTGGTFTAEIDNLDVRDYGGAWASFHGLATGYIMYPTSGDSIDSEPDAIIECKVSLVSGETSEISFRKIDVDNRLIVRLNQTSGTIKLVQVLSGVETELGTNTPGLSVGLTGNISIRAVGSLIKIFYSNAGGVLIEATSTLNLTTRGATITSTVPDGFFSWPITITTARDPVGIRPINIFPYGDSKTYGATDTPFDGRGYPILLTENLWNNHGIPAWELLRVGRGGYTVQALQDVVDADLAARSETPNYVLVNIGANNAAGGATEMNQATFEADYGYILDAIHTKWPSAWVGCARVWCRTSGTTGGIRHDNIIDDTYIPNIISTRPWAHLGPDERVFLENGDDGVTYTSDGVHPNHAGYGLTAEAWEVAMGY